MKLIFGHIWAVWWWRLAHGNATANDLRTNICSLPSDQSVALALKGTGAEETRRLHVGRGIPRDLPLEVVSKGSVPHARLSHAVIRRWNGYVPVGSICAAGDHLVCSPEFCLVLVACDIRSICQERLERWQYVLVLVELGCELCGTYSKSNDRRGFKNRNVQLVGTWQMRDFVCGIAHERGASLAYEALRWVIDGLNSPMETVVYLMLCLPRLWGGLALPRPRANLSLPVPMELWRKAKRRNVVPDLYWQEYGLAVEFFGEDFHTGTEHEDMERQETEQDMGLKVVTFWKEDVLDLRRFRAKADSIAHYLGMRLPEASDQFLAAQAKLQQMLVRHQRWI